MIRVRNPPPESGARAAGISRRSHFSFSVIQLDKVECSLYVTRKSSLAGPLGLSSGRRLLMRLNRRSTLSGFASFVFASAASASGGIGSPSRSVTCYFSSAWARIGAALDQELSASMIQELEAKEDLLARMLVSEPAALLALISEDFGSGNVVRVKGVVFSSTEASLFLHAQRAAIS